MIAANEDGVRPIFLVSDIAEHFRSTSEEVAFKFGPYRHWRSACWSASGPPSGAGVESEPPTVGGPALPIPVQRPRTNGVHRPYIALLVKVVSTSVRHQVVVASVEETLLNAPEVVPKALDFRSSWHIGRHGFPPLSHGFLERESSVTVKHGVEACSPAL